MNRQNALVADAGGTCAAGVLQRGQRTRTGVQLRGSRRAPTAAREPMRDVAPWVMRFVALALVLFVGVLLVLYG